MSFKMGKYVIAEDYKIGTGTQLGNFVNIKKSTIGKDNIIWHYVNIYDSKIGNKNTIGSFCEIGGSTIGSNNKIEAMTFIPLGVEIGNSCFIGPGVRFANDKHPRVVDAEWEWKVGRVVVEDNVAIGIASVILPNVRIGKHAFIAAGSLVTTAVPPNSFAMGRPASIVSFQTVKELGII
jgi:acetyltransferase-like isoleucine patch superfamily enzyme